MKLLFMGIQKCLADESRTIIKLTDELLDFIGYTQEEITTKFNNKYNNLILPTDFSQIKSNFNLFLKEKKNFTLTYHILSNYGNSVFINEQASFLIEDGVEYILFSTSMAKLSLELDFFYKNMLDSLPNAIFLTDLNLNLIFANTKCFELFNFDKDNYVGKSCSICGTVNCDTDNCCIKRLQKGLPITYIDEYNNRSLQVNTSLLLDDNGEPFGYTSTSIDITDIKEVERKLRVSDTLFHLALPHITSGIWEYDFRNKTLTRLSGRLANFKIPVTSYDFPESFISLGIIHPDSHEDVRHLFKALDNGINEVLCEIKLIDNNNELRWFKLSFHNVFDDDNEVINAVGVTTDITSKKELEKNATRDFLTNLYNRAYATKTITEMLSQYTYNVKAMLLVDIDDFKNINDAYGHLFGDQFLITIANTFLSIFDENDIVCRLGGDEFFIYMDNTTKDSAIEKAKLVLKEVKTAFAPKIPITSVSIGIAFVENEDVSFNELYDRSDRALYVAKENGKNQFVVFE